MAAGEGIETMLSLRQIMPALPLAAALSATNLAGLLFPPGLRRLYIVRDNDPAGRRADAALTARAQAEGIEALTLAPALKDFNDDLRQSRHGCARRFGPVAACPGGRDTVLDAGGPRRAASISMVRRDG